LWNWWKGFFGYFSSLILSWKGIPLVEDISLLVEREKGKKREEASASSPSSS
jgi:hypothetical protein